MNHKRKRPKSRRAGCLFCKPHKHQREGRLARLKPRYRDVLRILRAQGGTAGHVWLASD